MRIRTNIVSINSRAKLENNIREYDKESRKLATGDRINKAAYDPAGLIISEGMRSRIRSYGQAKRNATDSISLIQIAEGSLSSVQGMAARMKELALQSATDTTGIEERAMIDKEFQQIKKEIRRIIEGTQFNGKKILDRNAGIYEFQIGINSNGVGERVRYDMGKVISSSKRVSLGSASVGQKSGALGVLPKINSMLEEVSGARAFLGATQSRVESTVQNLLVSHENTSSANSRIRDTDVAESASKKIVANVKTNVASNVVAQANKLSESSKILLKSS